MISFLQSTAVSGFLSQVSDPSLVVLPRIAGIFLLMDGWCHCLGVTLSGNLSSPHLTALIATYIDTPRTVSLKISSEVHEVC